MNADNGHKTSGEPGQSFEKIIAALQGHGSHVKFTGNYKAIAQCPAHEDARPSLSLSWSGGDNPLTLVHCFAGCDSKNIMAELALRMSDLYDKEGSAAYTYRNPTSGWADRVVFRDPETKEFTQRIIKKTDKTPLYRRDLLRKARTDNLPVYLVEGEGRRHPHLCRVHRHHCPTGCNQLRQIRRVRPRRAQHHSHSGQRRRRTPMGTAGVPPRRISSRQHHIQDDRSKAKTSPTTSPPNSPSPTWPTRQKASHTKTRNHRQRPVIRNHRRSHPQQPTPTTATHSASSTPMDTKSDASQTCRWHHWDEQRWVKDDEGRTVREHAREHARTLPEGSRDEQKFKYLSMSSAGLTACIRVAETDPRVSILAGDLDAHPELINSPSGVVNLRTGETQHNPALLLSRITNHGANPKQHPQWDAFLTETFNGDQELISYMQKLFGLALLGMVTEHILVFLHGTGANGKGVLTLVLQGLLETPTTAATQSQHPMDS